MDAHDHASHGRVPIIVPGFRRLKSTPSWLSALVRHTRGACELVFFDPVPGDGHTAYLAGVRDMAPFPVRILSAPLDQTGIPSGAEYLVLLHQEALVTHGWLEQLTALARLSPEIGMAGPMSNLGPPAQRVQDGPGPDADILPRFASQWRTGHRGQWLATDRLDPFCVLVRRPVLEERGGLRGILQEVASPQGRPVPLVGGAGHILAVARDLYIPRFKDQTGTGAASGGGGTCSGTFPETGGQGRARHHPGPVPSGRLSRRRFRVSLTMIVRDEADNLPACLGPVADLFGETVVVDTGSTDRTVEVARSFGARVSHFSWTDDFASARNAALGRATGDFAFWLDADDRIEPSQIGTLGQLLDGLDRPDVAYVARCACDPSSDGRSGTAVVDHVRLFPILTGVRWMYRVHEQILPSLRRAGVSLRWSDLVIRHTGYSDPETRRRKLDRDTAILQAELAGRPGDPFVLFNLGSVAVERQQWASALPHLQASLAGSSPGDSVTRKLHTLIARCHQGLGDLDAALAACGTGLAEDPENAELLFRKAVAHRYRGQAEAAAACWRRILTLRRPERFASEDAGLYGHLPRRNLAALAEEQGDRGEALRLWQAVLAECPGDVAALKAVRRLEHVRTR